MMKRIGLLLGVLLLVSCFSITAFAKSVFLVKEGMRGDNVRQVQELLIANGFLTGSADGVCGSETVEAIKRFQQSVGVEADGICGDETIALLMGQAPTSNAADGSGPLKPGMSGDRVKEMQEMLFSIGYLQTAPDGVYGSVTEAAVISFQSAAGLTADGICGNATLARLRELAAGNSASNSAANVSDSGSGALKPGMTGDRVKGLQELLYKHGYLLTNPDGIYGNATEIAVMNFQSDTGLTPDGICGDATLSKLLNRQTDEVTHKEHEESAYAAPGSVIKPGMRGDGVILLQEYLIDLGYLSDMADGLFGPKSVSALKAFQRDNGLEPDGICGSSTYAALSMIPTPSDEPAPAKADIITGRQVRVEATAYSSMDPGMSLYTATGKFLRRGIISVDPSFIPLGTHVYIPGYGEATADDMGGDIRGNRIDVAFDTHEEAMAFGRQSIDIYILEE